MRKTLLICICISVYLTVNGQDITSTVNTKNLRPSLTSLFYQPQNNAEKVIINKLAELPVISKFDDNRIDFKNLSSSATTESDKEIELLQYVEEAARPILAKWWNRNDEATPCR